MLFRLRTPILVLLILVAVCANVIVPWLIWSVHGPAFLRHFGGFATGGLAVEVCVLAVWAALGTQPLIIRIPLTAWLLVVAAGSCSIGLRVSGRSQLFGENVFLLAALVLAWGGVQLPLWILRVVSQQRVGVPVTAGDRDSARRPPQFSFRHLLVASVMFGILLALVRQVLAAGQDVGGIQSLDLVSRVLALTAFAAVICPPCVWAILEDKPNGIMGVVLVILMLTTPHLIADAWSAFSMSGLGRADRMDQLTTFGMGIVPTLALMTYTLRVLGYRLVSPDGTSIARSAEVRSEVDTTDD